MLASPFDSVVFAGGGSRCVWQVGFWQVVAPAIGLRPTAIAAVSAGSAMAACLLAAREEAAIDHFSQHMAKNPKNFYPARIFKPGERAFPQADIYRKAMLETIDMPALRRIHEGPPIYILLARPPRWLGARSGALLGFLCYRIEKKILQPLHPTWGKRAGFQPWVLSSHDCKTPEELVDLILQSSCTPPFTPLFRRDGKIVLDGGLIDNVPVDALPQEALETGKTLVLLSRPYEPGQIKPHPQRLYVQPSQTAPVTTWDYTSPDRIYATYEMGKRDGSAFLAQYMEHLSEPLPSSMADSTESSLGTKGAHHA